LLKAQRAFISLVSAFHFYPVNFNILGESNAS